MRERYDALHKDLGASQVDDVGRVLRGHEVVASVQRVDLVLVPDDGFDVEGSDRGLLGRLADHGGICHIEPFRNTPDGVAIGQCVRRLLNHLHHEGEAGRRRAGRVVVVSPGRPRRAMAEHGLVAAPGFPPGVYCTPPGIGLWVIVVSELPATRETIGVRLMSKGPVFRRAVDDLLALPEGSWEDRLVEVLVRWRCTIVELPRPTKEDREFMGATQSAFERMQERAREEGLKQGLRKGLARGRKLGLEKGLQLGVEKGVGQGVEKGLRLLAHQVERRLGRSLRDDEVATLKARLDEVGVERLGDVVLDATRDELAAWLANPRAR